MSTTTIQTPVEAAVASGIEAINAGDVAGIRNAIYQIAELTGPKPKSGDYETKEEYKEAMNLWDSERKQKKHFFIAARNAGLAVTETYGASVSKSGAVSLSHSERVKMAATYAAARL